MTVCAFVNWTIRKRNGTVVPFDTKRIRRALLLCFHAVNQSSKLPNGEVGEDEIVSDIITSITNILTYQRITNPGVEDVQRLVLQQLWSRGLFEAAENYQNYREERRKARLKDPVDDSTRVRFDEMKRHFPTDLQAYQFMSKFSRWREEDKRRETWKETVYERVCPWLFRRPGVVLTDAEKNMLQDAMYSLEVSPAMRVVQMAGPALDRCNVGGYNCAYHPIKDQFAFAELLYILMQGTGSGFSVEDDYVSCLPRVKKQNGKIEKIVCEDYTESWCDTFHKHLQLLWDGWDTEIDTSKVRKKNSRLRTKGGRASGPGPLRELLDFSRNVIKSRQGRFLEDTDAHRIACFTGKIVQVGGVRRAAECSLSDLRSVGMRDIKSGTWWSTGAGLWPDAKYLSMSNNSAVYEDESIPIEVFMDEWIALVKSKAGERGIFNRAAANKYRPQRRIPWKFGCNPCFEIILRPFQFCNLSIAIARPWDTRETLIHKIRLAAYFGKIQSMMTAFGYIRPDWKFNCTEERLLGVDITGHADCPLLQYGAPGRAKLIEDLRRTVEEVDILLSSRWGVNRSAANTTIKPGGDSAVFFNCASGVSPWFDDHILRWVREPKDTPVAQFLRDSGVPYADAPESPEELAVFGFPRKAPPGATKRQDMTAIQQLENWFEWRVHYAEHSVSATIYVDDHEWLETGAWVYKNLDKITGVSFLPRDNGTYTYAPNESLTKEQYDKMVAEFPSLDWSKLTKYETDDQTGARATFACVGDQC